MKPADASASSAEAPQAALAQLVSRKERVIQSTTRCWAFITPRARVSAVFDCAATMHFPPMPRAPARVCAPLNPGEGE
jgi:hypothetical protein